MVRFDGDRNLLLGIQALQMDFIDRDQLVEAMNAWVIDKLRPLGQILREQGALADDELALLDTMVEKQLVKHAEMQDWLVPASGSETRRGTALAETVADVPRRGPAGPDLEEPLDLTRSYSGDAEGASRGSRYHKLRPHATGGLGEVSVAFDQELKREVALKEILTRHAHDAESRARFILEAEVTGGLEHPGVVPVYGLGQHPDGRPYYAMRLIKGVTLKQAIARFHGEGGPGGGVGRRSLPLRQLLGRFVAVCHAVAYAHSRGILHRDLKPSNVMLGDYGETLVVDWGLAKPLGRSEKNGRTVEVTLMPASVSGSTPTLVGSAIGTPQYMSPEQAAGRLDHLGPTSDVYSLGATLYCLLTGDTPFTDPDVPSVMQNVQRGEFPPPRRINRRIPAALEAICLKAMALAPADRYPSALALAGDIEHWLADEPLSVYREPLSTRLTRWGRRHKTASMGIATLLVTTSVALAISTILIGKARDETKQRHDEALSHLAEVKRKEVILQRQDYINKVNLAAREIQDNNIALAERLLEECPEPLRGWEWQYVRRQCHLELRTFRGRSNNVFEAAFSHDGRWIASAFGSYPQPTESDAGEMRIWEAATGREGTDLGPIEGGVTSVAYSPDGRWLAVGAGFHSGSFQGELSHRAALTLWDLATKRPVWSRPSPEHVVLSLAFSPDGKRLAAGYGILNDTGKKPGKFTIWRAESGEEELSIAGQPDSIDCGVAFSPDGRRIAVASGRIAEIWDLTDRRKLQSFASHTEWVCGVAFNHDGTRLATGGWDNTIKLWEAETGRELRSLTGHTGCVRMVTFSPDGATLASASEDKSIKLWDAATGREVETFRGHVDLVNSVAFSVDGSRIVSASRDGTVKLWDVKTSRQVVYNGRGGWAFGVAFRPDGRLVASASGYHGDNTITLWDPSTGKPVRVLRGHFGTVWGVAFSPDGTLLASASDDQTVRIWDVVTGREVRALQGHTQGIVGVAFSPDGGRIASASGDQTVRVWDAKTGRELFKLLGEANNASGVAFSPDGKRLASTHGNWVEGLGVIKIWDAKDGRELRTLRGHASGVHAVAFSPDGLRLVTTGTDRTSRTVGELWIWDLETGRELRRISGHTDVPFGLAFSPDGARIASASSDKTVKIWDSETGEELFTLRGHTGGVLGVAFSPDGLRIISGSMDGTSRIWDATPPSPGQGGP